MGLINADEVIKDRITALLYGVPGVGKTSLAITADKVVLIDTDNGISRVDLIDRSGKAVYRMEPKDGFQKLVDFINSRDFDSFDTVVIDTVGRLFDFIKLDIQKKNPKYIPSNGTPNWQGWGAIGASFKNFKNLLLIKGKNIILIAHEKEERNNDELMLRPDIQGSSRGVVTQEADIIGYMCNEGRGDSTQRVIYFDGFSQAYTKRCSGIESRLEFVKSPTFFNDNILTPFITSQQGDKEVMDKFNKVVEKYQDALKECSLDDFNSLFHRARLDEDHIRNSKEFVKDLFKKEAVRAIYRYDTVLGRWVSNKPVQESNSREVPVLKSTEKTTQANAKIEEELVLY